MLRLWPYSCPLYGHNMVSRGERELRGERRGKSGRSLLVTAAPLFYMALMFAPTLQAQVTGGPVRPEVRIGWLTSGTLVEDQLATPALRQAQGPRLGPSPTAWAAPGPELSLGVAIPLRPTVLLSGLAAWQPTKLRVQDVGGERDVQDLSTVAAVLEATFTLRRHLLLSGAAGVLGYRGEAAGLFADGADVSPLLRGGAGGRISWRGHLVSVRAVADLHHFSTPGIRLSGGSSGLVPRYGIQLGVVPGGAR